MGCPGLALAAELRTDCPGGSEVRVKSRPWPGTHGLAAPGPHIPLQPHLLPRSSLSLRIFTHAETLCLGDSPSGHCVSPSLLVLVTWGTSAFKVGWVPLSR